MNKSDVQKFIDESGSIHELVLANGTNKYVDRMYDYVINSRVVLIEVQTKLRELIPLLIECRDALPAITKERARLYSVDLSLDKKIERTLEPWEIKE